MKDNEYIKHGYRINFNSTYKVAKSLFMLHNESVNIWTHLLGALFLVILVFYTTVYIKYHKDDLLGLHINMTKINEEIKHVTSPVIELLPNLHNIT